MVKGIPRKRISLRLFTFFFFFVYAQKMMDIIMGI